MGTIEPAPEKPIAIRSWATVAGRKEGRGKLAQYYDFILEHNQFGEKPVTI